MLKVQDNEKTQIAMKKAAVWYFACVLVQKSISVLTTPIFTRLLSKAEFGEYNIYLSWYDTLGIFITLTLASSVYQRNVVINEKQKDEITSSMLGLATTSTVITFVLYLLFRKIIEKALGLSTLLMVAIWITCISTVTFELWAQKLRLDYKYQLLVVVTVIMSILKPTIGVLLILLNPTKHVESRVIGNLCVDLIVGLIIYVSLMRKGKFYNASVWKASLVYVLPLLPHYLSQRVLSQSDRIMIDRMIGKSEAGIYSLAYSIGMLLMMLNTVTDSTIAPWTYRNIRDQKYGAIEKLTKRLLLLSAQILICFLLIVPELVKIFATIEYYPAIWCIPPIGISAYIMILYIQLIYFEYYIGKTTYTTIATVAAAVLNLMLNYICIPLFGYIAAAYTTLICYVAYAIFHYCVVRRLFVKELNTKCIYSVKWFAYAIVAPIIMGLSIMFMYKLNVFIRGGVMSVLAIYTLVEGIRFLKESNINLKKEGE